MKIPKAVVINLCGDCSNINIHGSHRTSCNPDTCRTAIDRKQFVQAQAAADQKIINEAAREVLEDVVHRLTFVARETSDLKTFEQRTLGLLEEWEGQLKKLGAMNDEYPNRSIEICPKCMGD